MTLQSDVQVGGAQGYRFSRGRGFAVHHRLVHPRNGWRGGAQNSPGRPLNTLVRGLGDGVGQIRSNAASTVRRRQPT